VVPGSDWCKQIDTRNVDLGLVTCIQAVVIAIRMMLPQVKVAEDQPARRWRPAHLVFTHQLVSTHYLVFTHRLVSTQYLVRTLHLIFLLCWLICAGTDVGQPSCTSPVYVPTRHASWHICSSCVTEPGALSQRRALVGTTFL
jgi:hypothetical protein